MKQLIKIASCAVAAATILSAGCSYQPGSGTMGTPPTTLLWRETGARFDTKDLARAQEEIPFAIVLPSYVPGNQGDPATQLPQITGTLRAYQRDNRVQIEVFYIAELGRDTFGVVRIRAANYPVVPGDPETNPDNQYVEIAGKTMIKTEGNFQEGPGIIFYFNQGGIYYEVGVYNFPSNDAFKVVESLVR